MGSIRLYTGDDGQAHFEEIELKDGISLIVEIAIRARAGNNFEISLFK